MFYIIKKTKERITSLSTYILKHTAKAHGERQASRVVDLFPLHTPIGDNERLSFNQSERLWIGELIKRVINDILNGGVIFEC